MFCPICKAEYRFGFTKCSDCGVDLVEYVLGDAGAPVLEGYPDEIVVFWAGMEDVTCQSIERALDTAKIQYNSDIVESQLMPAFRTTIYRIQVRRADYRAAVEAVKEIESGNPLGPKSPADVQDRNSSFLNLLGINRNLLNRPIEDQSAAV